MCFSPQCSQQLKHATALLQIQRPAPTMSARGRDPGLHPGPGPSRTACSYKMQMHTSLAAQAAQCTAGNPAAVAYTHMLARTHPWRQQSVSSASSSVHRASGPGLPLAHLSPHITVCLSHPARQIHSCKFQMQTSTAASEEKERGEKGVLAQCRDRYARWCHMR